MKKKLINYLLVASLLIASIISSTTFSSEAATTSSKYTGNTYTHNAKFDGYKIYHGIDVSKWQGSIAWKKVKAAGIDYAFIRVGYSGTASGNSCTDVNFATNINNAYAAGIKVGIYYFSQARNTTEALAEAQYTLNLIEPYKSKITLPVAFDFEPVSGNYAYGLSKATVTDNTIVFCNTIRNAGYQAMYYTSPNFSATCYDITRLKSYPAWVAHYGTLKTSYAGDYIFWQYSSTGKVDGISGNVDMNFYYASSPTINYITSGKDTGPYAGTGAAVTTPTISYKEQTVKNFKVTERKASSISLSWSRNTTATGYQIYRSTTEDGTYSKLTTLTNSTILSYQDTTIKEGTNYYYKIRAYKTVNGTNYYSNYTKVSSIAPAPVVKVNKVAGFKQTKNTATSITLGWTKSTDADGYQIYFCKSPNGSFSNIKTITKASTTSWTHTSRAKNTQYYYKIRAYKTVNGVKKYSSFSSIKAGYTLKYSNKYKKTTAALNVRSYPGTAYSKITTLPVKKQVKLIYATKASNGITWYKISWSGKTGYVCGTYLK